MTFISLALGALLITHSASARLPDFNLSAKDASAALRDASQRYSDNPSIETAARFKEALVKARASGALKSFERPEAYNDDQLRRTSKYLQVAMGCELVALDQYGLVANSTIYPQPPTPAQIDAFKARCNATTTQVIPIGGALKPAGANK